MKQVASVTGDSLQRKKANIVIVTKKEGLTNYLVIFIVFSSLQINSYLSDSGSSAVTITFNTDIYLLAFSSK